MKEKFDFSDNSKKKWGDFVRKDLEKHEALKDEGVKEIKRHKNWVSGGQEYSVDIDEVISEIKKLANAVIEGDGGDHEEALALNEEYTRLVKNYKDAKEALNKFEEIPVQLENAKNEKERLDQTKGNIVTDYKEIENASRKFEEIKIQSENATPEEKERLSQNLKNAATELFEFKEKLNNRE